MENDESLFLCNVCDVQFPTALLLSNHCAVQHQGYELSPFCARTTDLPLQAASGTVVQSAHQHEVDHQNHATLHNKQQSQSDVVLTQLQPVTPNSRLNLEKIPANHRSRENVIKSKIDQGIKQTRGSAVDCALGHHLQPTCNLPHSQPMRAEQNLTQSSDNAGQVLSGQVLLQQHHTSLQQGTLHNVTTGPSLLGHLNLVPNISSGNVTLQIRNAYSATGHTSFSTRSPNGRNDIGSVHYLSKSQNQLWMSQSEGQRNNMNQNEVSVIQSNQGNGRNYSDSSQGIDTGKRPTNTVSKSSSDSRITSSILPVESVSAAKRKVSGLSLIPPPPLSSLISISSSSLSVKTSLGSNGRTMLTPAIPISALMESAPQATPVNKPGKPLRDDDAPRPHACKVCAKTFSLKCNLLQHEICAHSDDRPFACTACDKTFKLKGHLKDHEHNVHSQDRPFICGQCKKAFKQNSHLKSHMTIHQGEKPFRCETCGIRFRQNQHLKRHALIHRAGTMPRRFPCPRCPSTFHIGSDLARHLRIHTGERPFRCPECGKGFARKQALKIHARTHSRPFACQRCSKSFGDMGALGEHEKMHASTVPHHDCRTCGLKFNLLLDLKRHVETHLDKKDIMSAEDKTDSRTTTSDQSTIRMTRQRTAEQAKEKSKPKRVKKPENKKTTKKTTQEHSEDRLCCTVCDRAFLKHCFVLRHEMKCHGIQHNPYDCKDCGETFMARNGLIKHSEQHKSFKTFKCSKCSKEFKVEFRLFSHQACVHGDRPYRCEMCSKTFAQKTSFTRHSKTCQSKDDHPCEQCDARFQSGPTLQKHRVMKHGLKPFACETCPSAFTNRAALLRHEVTHSEDRPFSCEFCSKRFKEKRQLRQHEALHGSTRPYQCFHCGLAFHRKPYLQRHEAIHMGEKRFPCPHCPRAFFMSHDLKRHMRIHTGEKPFSCVFCKKPFRRKAAAAFHEKHVHLKKFRCSYCSRKFFTQSELDVHRVVHTGFSGPDSMPHSQVDAQHNSEGSTVTPEDDGSRSSSPPGSDSLDPGPADQEQVVTMVTPDPPPGNKEEAPAGGITINSADNAPQANAGSQINNNAIATTQAQDVTFFLCNFCGSLFPTASMLALHTQTRHKPDLNISHQISTDGNANSEEKSKGPRKSRKKQKLSKTPKSTRGTEMLQMCAACGEAYTGESDTHECIDLSKISQTPNVLDEDGKDLIESSKVCDPPQNGDLEERLFRCTYCQKGFKKSSNCNVHERSHTEDKPYGCKTCNKSFAVKSNLKQHELTKHTDARPFACTTCCATFKQRSHLKSHELIHAGIKGFKCDVCEQTFRQSAHLQRHKLVHDGIKLYKCEQCPSAFNLVSDLQRHVLIHTGQKPFECEHCSKCFRRKYGLKMHITKTHAGEIPLSSSH